MCKCISNIEKKVVKQLSTDKEKILKATFLAAAIFPLSKNSMTKTISEIEVTTEGKKKKRIVNMVHTYCPFCGVKY